MTVRIGYTGRTDGVALRDVFARVLARIGEDPDFVYLDADLMSSVGTRDWAAETVADLKILMSALSKIAEE